MSNEKLFSEFPSIQKSEWEEVINKDLKGADYEKKLVWNTQDGFKVQPYYRAEDLEKISYLSSSPDSYPFVRGNKTSGNQWEIRQDIHGKTPQEINELAILAIRNGAEGIGLCMKDIDSAEKLATVLTDIDLSLIHIHFIKVTSFTDLMKWFADYLDKNAIDAKTVVGSIDFDPFDYALRHGHFYHNLLENIAEAATLIKTYKTKFPYFHFINVNGGRLHNAGATITQELGYTLAWAHEYIHLLIESGLSIDEITPCIRFSMAAGSNYFMEIAKIRAARLLWARIVEQYQPKNTDSEKIFIHSDTSTWNQSVYDPYVNMLRSTTEAMSLAIGGADSITVVPFNTPYQDADTFSSRMSRNQQILLKEESLMDKVVDPAAGSYYIETLTDDIAAYAWKIFQSVEEIGGFTKAVEGNALQEAIAESAAKRDMDIATRKIILLGTNQFPNLTEHVSKVKTPCTCQDNEPKSFKTLSTYRGSAAFEALRLSFEQGDKKRPVVFLLTYGNLAMRKARAGFAANFFGCAGFDIIDNPGFATVEEGVKAAMAKNADVVVLCSSDEEYQTLVPEACQVLKGTGFKGNITLAGHPGEQQAAYQAAGVHEFIHVKSNILETLKKY